MAQVERGGSWSDRLGDVLRIMRDMGDYAEEREVDAIFILGDLFNRANPDGPSVVYACAVLSAISKHCPVYILPGNHDAVDPQGRLYNVHFLRALGVPDIHVLNRSTHLFGGRVVVHPLPYVPEARAARQIASIQKNMDEADVNILLMHQSVMGARLESGMASAGGLDPEETTKGFAAVYSGHFHRSQTFGRCGRYLGSPLDLRFGDEDVDFRGYWEITINLDGEIDEELIYADYPRFCTVKFEYGAGECDEHNFEEEIESALDEFCQTHYRHDDDDAEPQYIRIVMTGPAYMVDKAMREASHWASQNETRFRVVKIICDPTREEVLRLDVPGPTDLVSLPAIVRAYGERYLDNNQELIELGLSFLGDE